MSRTGAELCHWPVPEPKTKIDSTAMESERAIRSSRDELSLVVYDFVEFMGYGWWGVDATG